MSEGTVYRRSSLRAALLDRATEVLRKRGVGALSLRELARDLGVSHTAPARHFADRRELLEALAIEGFALLGTRLQEAASGSGRPERQAALVARSYLAFVLDEANLAAVMYVHEAGQDRSVIGRSAQAAFGPLLAVFEHGERIGVVPQGTSPRAATMLLAALQGAASLVGCGVIARDDVPALVDDLVPRFIGAVVSPGTGSSP